MAPFLVALVFRSSNHDDGFSSNESDLDGDADSDGGSSTSTANSNASTYSRNLSNSSFSGKCHLPHFDFLWPGLIHFILFLFLTLFLDPHSPIKLTKRWRQNHEEEQLQQAEHSFQPKRPNLLDLSFASSGALCTNSNIVNWLSQTSNMALPGDYCPVVGGSELSSSLSSDHSLSSPTSSSSLSSGIEGDDPFGCLYLLASAAVDRLSNADHMRTVTIKT